MLNHKPPLAGFTTFAAEGHGLGFASATVSERVRGRVQRSVLVAVMQRDEATRLLELVRQKAAVAHMAYWIEPVLDCGRIVHRAKQAAEGAALASQPLTWPAA
ncbi:MAG: DUF3240 family protein [Hyphomicrobium sp.]